MIRFADLRFAATASQTATASLVKRSISSMFAKNSCTSLMGVLVVHVQRQEIRHVEGVVQDLILPGAEGRHVAAGRSASRNLNRRIDPLHDLPGLCRDAAVFRRGFLTGLPRPIHLVSQAPKLYGVRLLVAVRGSEIAPARASGMIAILDVFPRFVGAARSEIDAQHWLCLGELAPLDKLIRSKRVGFGAQPGEIQAPWPFLCGADAILPIAARHVIASRITNDRRAEFSNQLEDVPSEPVTVRRGMARLENACVDAAAHMLNEGAKEAPIELGNAKISDRRLSGLYSLGHEKVRIDL